ncbi:MAG TPA: hypothetical protein VKU41_18685 [Polyangiaceae bacterium]|nr:hypothetical protein [Polyangiaceae bacterium]
MKIPASGWLSAVALFATIGGAGCGSSDDSSAPMETGGVAGVIGAIADGDAAVRTKEGGGGVEASGEDAARGGPVAEASSSPPSDAGSSPEPAEAGDRSTNGASEGAAEQGGGSPCSGGKALSASDAPGIGSSSEYAAVKWIVAGSAQLVGLYATMIVPQKPSATSGTLYAWPGVQPYSNSVNYSPIGDGILQPVLSIGPTCGPGAPSDYKSWWISGQYVNPSGPTGFNGCLGGPGMDATIDDALDISVTLSGTVWTQVVTSRRSSQSVTYSLDLKGQGQNWATLAIEQPTSLAPVSDAVFTSTRLTFSAPDQASCQPSQHGPNDYFATPYASADGKTCCVSRVILRQRGVAATTMNGP